MKRILLLFLLAGQLTVTTAQNITQLGPNYFISGVNSHTFQFYDVSTIGNQRSQNWCWAACIQMVLNYHGLIVTQEQVVQRCYGSLIDQPGGEIQLFTALSGQAPNVWGRSSRIFTDRIIPDPAAIQDALARNLPLIIGLNNPNSPVGHAVVLSGIYYSYTYNYLGQVIGIIPDKIVVRDPWPSNRDRQEISWMEFINRVNTVHRVWVTYD